MIVAVGQYPTIPLEMSIVIVYGSPKESPACGIAWKTCIRERWDPDRPYDVVAKGCHTWSIRGRVCHVGQIYTPARLVIDLNVCNTLGYE
jgi:hypothetical protein